MFGEIYERPAGSFLGIFSRGLPEKALRRRQSGAARLASDGAQILKMPAGEPENRADPASKQRKGASEEASVIAAGDFF